MGLWMVLLGWVLFAGTHIGLCTEPIRSNLVSKTGEKVFQGLYSFVALVTFAFLITAFVLADDEGTLVMAGGATTSWMIHISNFLMLMALIFFFCSFTNPSPMGIAKTKPEAYGIIRITRHPMNISFALFGLSHVLTNRTGVDWIFYLGFTVYGVLGAVHQDRKKVHQRGPEFQAFVDSTSILPFVAIIRGKQPFKLSEISKLGLLVAVAITITARVLHPAIRSQLF